VGEGGRKESPVIVREKEKEKKCFLTYVYTASRREERGDCKKREGEKGRKEKGEGWASTLLWLEGREKKERGWGELGGVNRENKGKKDSGGILFHLTW